MMFTVFVVVLIVSFSLSATMLSYVNKRWSERGSWQRNTETEREKGETESTKITKRPSSSAPPLTTEPSDPPPRRESRVNVAYSTATGASVFFC